MSSTPSPSSSSEESSASSSAAATNGAPTPQPHAPAGDPGPTAAEQKSDESSLPLDDLATTIGADTTVSELDGPTLPTRIKTLLIGKPRDLKDTSLFHHVTLIAFLAWVGLGADGLSSSCYGPQEIFLYLRDRPHLAVFLSLLTIITVIVISNCYSHIIEEFPSGGGGYLVASKLLGRRVGVVSGCALLVDYVLTITVSIAAAGDALFGLVDPRLHTLKLPAELVAILLLIVLNLRGIKESVKVLLPIFLTFLVCHIVLILGSIGLHLGETGAKVAEIGGEISKDLNDANFGLWGMIALILRAYSMGAGTYTGIEAVSNSMPVMREPRVATAKRTMLYMGLSLALTAGGLIIAYMLLDIRFVEGDIKTMNTKLAEVFVRNIGLADHKMGLIFIAVTVISEGALLFAAAQAGFIDGPRVLANMAHDSWMPHWFANLSERLATHNGILLMGCSAVAALVLTHGETTLLVVMYSINVFLTFSLSMLGMLRHWWRLRGRNPLANRRLAVFGLGAAMCLCILGLVVYEKCIHPFVHPEPGVNPWTQSTSYGGLVTIAVTSALVLICFMIHRHYRGVVARLKRLDDTLSGLPSYGNPELAPPDHSQPAAAILVGGYGGLGVHTMLNAIRFAPGHFKSVIFLSSAVVDSGNFKGADAVDALQHHCEEALGKYVDLANRLGMPSTSYLSIGTDAVEELERMCLEIHRQFPKAIFFAGQLIFQRDTFVQRLLHNQTAQSLQRRLQWSGLPMVILPTRVR
ncbi:MAG: APC family permease [Planctomycetes bacterium]|nr:APC family permease [Planctomycetota bacterium]